jgi:hypothetical protein
VVERTLAWLSKCRAILIRWDKKAENYLGLLKLACTLLWFRRYRRLSHTEGGAFGSQHDEFSPNRRYDHVFAIIRVDRFDQLGATPEEAITITKVVRSREAAEAEVSPVEPSQQGNGRCVLLAHHSAGAQD